MDRPTVVLCMVTAALATLAVRAKAQAPPVVDELLTRVGERIANYYRRAQNVICVEKYTVQPIGGNFSPLGFARTVESELHVESEPGYDNPAGEAKVIREVRRINGRPPRDRDRKDRSTCMDPNPLSTEPLAFLLPPHRSEFQFASAGFAKDKNRNTLVIEFASINRKSRPELIEDELGRDDCFDWSGHIATKGRIWVDADTYDVVRVDRGIGGPVDVKVSTKLQSRYHFFSGWVVIDREDVTIRYTTVAFRDPDEVMLLPESIDSLSVIRGGLQSTRRRQTFSDYKRFITGGRIVK